MTKNALMKLAKDVEQLGGMTRFLAATLKHHGLLKEGDGQLSFTDPKPEIPRGLLGRLKWLVRGR